MSNRTINKATLMKTSAASDVIQSGGKIKVAGLLEVSKKDIISIQQVKYRAEVAQVVRIGTSSYTPALDTPYSVEIGDPNRRFNGIQESPTIFTVRTPTAWNSATGATDALRREWIHGQLITKINAQTNKIRATAVTLATGTGFSVTDSGGYFAVRGQDSTNVLGANLVRPKTNSDGSGFAASDYSVTTAAVASFGVGATLASQKAVVDKIFGNLISGQMWAQPLTTAGAAADTGQQYDAFLISSLKREAMPTIQDFTGYVEREDVVYVDNGLGTSVTNLAGFKAIERVFHKLMVQQYAQDACTVQEWFDKPIVFQDPLGAAPTGTADTLGWQLSPYGSLNRTNINAQTVVVPVLGSTGLLITQDQTATDGSHTSANQQTLGDQSFVVGKTAFMAVARVVMGDWTDSAFRLGFRKKAVYTAVINNYTDYGTVGNGSSVAGTTWINGDLFTTQGNINSGTPVQAISAVAPTDAVSVVLMLKVAIDGTVSAYVDGVSYPIYSVGTTTLIFDAGDEMIPFYQQVNIGSGDPALVISEFFAVATTELIS